MRSGRKLLRIWVGVVWSVGRIVICKLITAIRPRNPFLCSRGRMERSGFGKRWKNASYCAKAATPKRRYASAGTRWPVARTEHCRRIGIANVTFAARCGMITIASINVRGATKPGEFERQNADLLNQTVRVRAPRLAPSPFDYRKVAGLSNRKVRVRIS